LEKYDELVQYYITMHTKHQMEDFNAELDEWWGLAKA
jgi:hypothetical protein